jgi:arginine N-succinyltransferase
MMRIRPVRETDIDQLHALALRSGIGMTTLPKDRESLVERIALSERSFAEELTHPDDEYYFFMLEDCDSGKLVGTSALASAVGMNQPFYTYTVGKVVHASPKLKVHNIVETLYLGNDYTGCTEICTLFLLPEFRGGNNGRLLSRSRFLFMAEFAERFADKVIAEMRGVSDKDGNSPFWDALGKKFFSMEFPQADALCTYGNEFIAELMPAHPVYTCLLSDEARRVIGKVHPDTQPAYDMLMAEGFRYSGHVDIFDAGPTIDAPCKEIRTVRNSHRFDVVVQDTISAPRERYLVSNCERINWRVTIAEIAFDEQGNAVIDRATASALELDSGAKIRACRMY